MGDCERGERVGGVEVARELRGERELAVRGLRGEARIGDSGAQIAGAVVGIAVQGEGHGGRELGLETAAVGAVDVDDRDRRTGLEEAALGGEVVLHRRMEVEVVLGQVGEDGGGEMRAVGAVEGERMRGDLDRAGAVPDLEHPGEGGLEVDRLGRRVDHLAVNAADHRLDRPEQRGLLAAGLEELADQEGRRCLAVGPGDANDA